MYGTYVVVDLQMRKSDALVYCKVMGGHLAAFETETEFNHIVTHLERSKFHWIGGNDEGEEGTFVWDHSGVKLNDTFSKWFHPTGEPNNLKGEEHCLMILLEAFFDYKCDNKIAFICEIS